MLLRSGRVLRIFTHTDSTELERSSVDWHIIHHCERRLLASVLVIMTYERCLQLMLMAFTEVLLVHRGKWHGRAEVE